MEKMGFFDKFQENPANEQKFSTFIVLDAQKMRYILSTSLCCNLSWIVL